jgi:hypothetical protein
MYFIHVEYKGSIFKLLRSQGIDSASLCSLAGLYDNHIPTRFLVTIEYSKIPAQYVGVPTEYTEWQRPLAD